MPTVKEGVPHTQACGILNVSYGKWLQSFVNCICSLKVGLVKAVAVIPVVSCSFLQCYFNASVVVFYHIVLGQGCCGERLFLHFFSVLCPVCFQYPRPSGTPNSLYVQVSLRIEHHVRWLNVIIYFNIHYLANCLHCNSFAISYFALYRQYNE